jgi:hypothetical protein
MEQQHRAGGFVPCFGVVEVRGSSWQQLECRTSSTVFLLLQQEVEESPGFEAFWVDGGSVAAWLVKNRV